MYFIWLEGENITYKIKDIYIMFMLLATLDEWKSVFPGFCVEG